MPGIFGEGSPVPSTPDFLEAGVALFEAYAQQAMAIVDVEAIAQSLTDGDAGRALYALMEQYRSERMLDGKAIALYQRAICGLVLKAGLLPLGSKTPAH